MCLGFRRASLSGSLLDTSLHVCYSKTLISMKNDNFSIWPQEGTSWLQVQLCLLVVVRLLHLPLPSCRLQAAARDITFKGPCTQIVHTLAPKYLCRDYFNAKVYAIWVHGPLGLGLLRL